MATLLERKLIVVTGKGGTGKSTIACALGLLAAQRGLRAIVVEVGDQHRLPELFARWPSADRLKDSERTGGITFTGDANRSERTKRAHNARPKPGDRTVELQEGLWSTSIDPDRAMFEWLQTLTGRISARLLASSNTFQYFAAAAPGAKELLSMMQVRELCEGTQHEGSEPYDLVVLDAPATGHALAMLGSPRTFAAIVRAGPLAEHARAVLELLEDPKRSGYVAVAQGTEMAVTETLELGQGLRQHLDRDLDTIVVNGTVPRRFTNEELVRVSTSAAKATPLARSAGHMARTVYERARLQQSQIARLRRQRFANGRPPYVITIPFVFTPELDFAALQAIANRLDRWLDR